MPVYVQKQSNRLHFYDMCKNQHKSIDKEGSDKRGIRIANLFHRCIGRSVNVQIGNKAYSLHKKSFQKFCNRVNPYSNLNEKTVYKTSVFSKILNINTKNQTKPQEIGSNLISLVSVFQKDPNLLIQRKKELNQIQSRFVRLESDFNDFHFDPLSLKSLERLHSHLISDPKVLMALDEYNEALEKTQEAENDFQRALANLKKSERMKPIKTHVRKLSAGAIDLLHDFSELPSEFKIMKSEAKKAICKKAASKTAEFVIKNPALVGREIQKLSKKSAKNKSLLSRLFSSFRRGVYSFVKTSFYKTAEKVAKHDEFIIDTIESGYSLHSKFKKTKSKVKEEIQSFSKEAYSSYAQSTKKNPTEIAHERQKNFVLLKRSLAHAKQRLMGQLNDLKNEINGELERVNFFLNEPLKKTPKPQKKDSLESIDEEMDVTSGYIDRASSPHWIRAGSYTGPRLVKASSDIDTQSIVSSDSELASVFENASVISDISSVRTLSSRLSEDLGAAFIDTQSIVSSDSELASVFESASVISDVNSVRTLSSRLSEDSGIGSEVGNDAPAYEALLAHISPKKYVYAKEFLLNLYSRGLLVEDTLRVLKYALNKKHLETELDFERMNQIIKGHEIQGKSISENAIQSFVCSLLREGADSSKKMSDFFAVYVPSLVEKVSTIPLEKSNSSYESSIARYLENFVDSVPPEMKLYHDEGFSDVLVN
ncbi:MAG: hypothetical protein S4CHLAM7_04100 [Chlamydiae bacterium]|nr:hypothetical protein [Chlamydiota bacterium]